jgi:hypothetical protein
VACSLLLHQNEHQRSVNDLWSCIFGNIGGAGSEVSIHSDLAASIGIQARYIPATASQTVTTYFIYKPATKCLLGVLAYKNKQNIMYR